VVSYLRDKKINRREISSFLNSNHLVPKTSNWKRSQPWCL